MKIKPVIVLGIFLATVVHADIENPFPGEPGQPPITSSLPYLVEIGGTGDDGQTWVVDQCTIVKEKTIQTGAGEDKVVKYLQTQVCGSGGGGTPIPLPTPIVQHIIDQDGDASTGPNVTFFAAAIDPTVSVQKSFGIDEFEISALPLLARNNEWIGTQFWSSDGTNGVSFNGTDLTPEGFGNIFATEWLNNPAPCPSGPPQQFCIDTNLVGACVCRAVVASDITFPTPTSVTPTPTPIGIPTLVAGDYINITGYKIDFDPTKIGNPIGTIEWGNIIQGAVVWVWRVIAGLHAPAMQFTDNAILVTNVSDDGTFNFNVNGTASVFDLACVSCVSLTSEVSGILPVVNGGLGATGVAAVAQGTLLYGAASGVWADLAKDSNATRYLANTGSSNNPKWDRIDLSNGVTGDLPKANGGVGGITSCGQLGTDSSNHATCIPTPAPVQTPPFSSNDLSTNSKTHQWSFGYLDPTVDLAAFTNRPQFVNKSHDATITKVCCYADVSGIVISGRRVPTVAGTPAAIPTPAACATPSYTQVDAGCITGLSYPLPKDAEFQWTVNAVSGNKSVRVVLPYTTDDD